jgi:hypothetical protein
MSLNLIVTATGFKVGSKGKVANTPEKAGIEFGNMNKGEARKARKMLFVGGKRHLAAAPRLAKAA